MFSRGDEHIYEIPAHHVQIVNMPLLWPAVASSPDARHSHPQGTGKLGARPERAYDHDILTEFYRGIRPFSSPELGIYWGGPLELLDGSTVQVVVLEDSAADKPTYSVTLREPPAALTRPTTCQPRNGRLKNVVSGTA